MIHRIEPIRRSHPVTTAAGGFTLLELMTVLMISATLAAVALPRYAQAVARYRADGAARRIVADLNLARQHAAATSSAVAVTFSTADHGYTIPALTDLNTRSGTYVVRLTDSPYQAKLVSADFTGSPTVTFDGFGQPDRTGYVVVAVGPTQRRVTVPTDGGQPVITVESP